MRQHKLGKAQERDKITKEMLKFLEATGKEKLLDILNDIIMTKNIPSDWNVAIILLIYKKEQAINCSNYRGITVTNIYV